VTAFRPTHGAMRSGTIAPQLTSRFRPPRATGTRYSARHAKLRRTVTRW
jgi:hypothetical protein